jgi:hypothetical protein
LAGLGLNPVAPWRPFKDKADHEKKYGKTPKKPCFPEVATACLDHLSPLVSLTLQPLLFDNVKVLSIVTTGHQTVRHHPI